MKRISTISCATFTALLAASLTGTAQAEPSVQAQPVSVTAYIQPNSIKAGTGTKKELTIAGTVGFLRVDASIAKIMDTERRTLEFSALKGGLKVTVKGILTPAASSLSDSGTPRLASIKATEIIIPTTGVAKQKTNKPPAATQPKPVTKGITVDTPKAFGEAPDLGSPKSIEDMHPYLKTMNDKKVAAKKPVQVTQPQPATVVAQQTTQTAGANSAPAKLVQPKLAEANVGETKPPVEAKPTEVKPTEVKPTEIKRIELGPATTKLTEGKPAEITPIPYPAATDPRS